MKTGTLKMKYLRRVWALKYNLLQIASAALIFLLAPLCCDAKDAHFIQKALIDVLYSVEDLRFPFL